MPRIESILIAGAIAVAWAPPLGAVPRSRLSLPAGSLADALVALGTQANVTVGIADASLGALRTRGADGRLNVAQALAHLLRGLPARAERIDTTTWRVVRAPPPQSKRRIGASHADRVPVAGAEIIVTATKRDTPLGSYPGTAYLINGGGVSAGEGERGTDTIVARLPTLASTQLGPGRNKLFIRGIADSSFNGPSQATVGEYLDDVRLNYNAPDPNLSLIDVRSIEVLEGPQGTLYGAGTLGGVMRIVPNPVRLDRVEGAIAAGASLTAHGAGGSDVDAVVNLPVVTERLGLRAVAYRSVDGGYIDDLGRGLADINRTVTRGARLTLRILPGNGWTVDLGSAIQNSNSDDGQYAERGRPLLTRSSRIAQPFDNDYALASVAVAKEIGAIALHATAGLVAQDVDSRFDFTAPDEPATAFDENDRIRLLSGDIHLARRSSDGAGWIVGVSALHDAERLNRALGPAAAPSRILGVENSVTNISAYSELGAKLRPALVATFGVRLDYAHLVGGALDHAAAVGEPRRDEVSVLPSVALSWRPQTGDTIFARYQQGFRPGGLAITGDGAANIERFHGDSLSTVEFGYRATDLARTGLDGAVSLSYARWTDIQADLVDASGLPITANIGTGRVYGLEGRLGWPVRTGIRLEAAIFLNKSRLTDPAATLPDAAHSALPNIAKAGARGAIDVRLPLSERIALTGGASVRYFGHSRLGIGPVLSLLQGGYVDTSTNLRLGTDRLGLTLGASNLLDARGSRFALGNPFDVAQGRQIVPLRPRTLRIGVDARF